MPLNISTTTRSFAEYLTATLEDGDPNVFLAALGDVARARGMAQIAEAAGLGRENLYKALSEGSHPRYETISAVLHALGVKFAVVSNTPAHKAPNPMASPAQN